MALLVENVIPITREQARQAGDFSQPVDLVGYRWWLRHSPEFRVWSNVAWVLAWREAMPWEAARDKR